MFTTEQFSRPGIKFHTSWIEESMYVKWSSLDFLLLFSDMFPETLMYMFPAKEYIQFYKTLHNIQIDCSIGVLCNERDTVAKTIYLKKQFERDIELHNILGLAEKCRGNCGQHFCHATPLFPLSPVEIWTVLKFSDQRYKKSEISFV